MANPNDPNRVDLFPNMPQVVDGNGSAPDGMKKMAKITHLVPHKTQLWKMNGDSVVVPNNMVPGMLMRREKDGSRTWYQAPTPRAVNPPKPDAMCPMMCGAEFYKEELPPEQLEMIKIAGGNVDGYQDRALKFSIMEHMRAFHGNALRMYFSETDIRSLGDEVMPQNPGQVNTK